MDDPFFKARKSPAGWGRHNSYLEDLSRTYTTALGPQLSNRESETYKRALAFRERHVHFDCGATFLAAERQFGAVGLVRLRVDNQVAGFPRCRLDGRHVCCVASTGPFQLQVRGE